MSTPTNWCSPGPPDPDPTPESQQVPPEVSSLCHKGFRPLLITGLLRDLLIRHFATPLNLEEPDLRQYVWSDTERTGILIESIHRWVGTLVEKRPAIILKRNSYQNIRWGIRDEVRQTERGFVEYATGWVGSHTAFCIHGKGASAEVLHTEVAREIHQFHPVITRYLGLLRWGVTGVGPVSQIEEAREGFVVPVTVGWVYQDAWTLKQESMMLRRIPFSTLIDFQPLDSEP